MSAHIHKCACGQLDPCWDDCATTPHPKGGDMWPRGADRPCEHHAAAAMDRQARTISRLRALADGYRGQRKWLRSVVAKACVQERARIVARLREWAEDSEASSAFRADMRWAAEFIESEEP